MALRHGHCEKTKNVSVRMNGSQHGILLPLQNDLLSQEGSSIIVKDSVFLIIIIVKIYSSLLLAVVLLFHESDRSLPIFLRLSTKLIF